MNKTSISWVLSPDGSQGYSWNCFAGCSPNKVSPGCAHCYAERLAATRLAHLPAYRGLVHQPTKYGHWSGEVRFFPEKLAEPLRRRKPSGIFCGDMGDIALLPFPQIAAIFGVMAACSGSRFFLLTKRPERLLEFWQMILGAGGLGQYIRQNWETLRRFFENDACNRFGTYRGKTIRTHQDAGALVLNMAGVQGLAWPRHVWLGSSASTQKDLDRVARELVQIPAAVRFLSLEPCLEEMDLERAFAVHDEHGEPSGPRCNKDGSNAIALVICGGESGPNARPCQVDWLRSIVRQCADAGVKCWVKQVGAFPIIGGAIEEERDATRQMEWPRDRKVQTTKRGVDGKRYPILLTRDRAGADMSEWPEDLHVRQMPKVKP